MVKQQAYSQRRPTLGLIPLPLRYMLCAALLWLLLPLPASAVEAPETIDPDASCATGECHTDIASLPHIHWSDFAEVGECETCHESDEGAHVFETDGSNENCLDCHDEIGEKMESAKMVHEAAEDGCIDCHDPHGGHTPARLVGIRSENLKSLCFDCHESEILDEEVKHGPAAEGACNLCHDPHASQNEALLLDKGVDLCGACHEEIAEGIKSAKIVHEPVEDGCVDCHNPHSGSHPLMLSGEKRMICNECHDDIVDIAENASVDHSPALTGDECLTCHTPHASNASPNLRMPERELCLSCHDKPVESGDTELMDMKTWLEENTQWHEPVTEDDCGSCHDPHGSNHFRILRDPFPAKFYNKFDLENFGLCFTCHEETLVLTEYTRNLTNFRNGNQNLHFLHVNREKKGRSCRACHEVHSSKSPLHIRASVPFGKWDMPINFEKMENGGSCAPGCHEDFDYDRKATDVADEEPKS